MKIFNFNKKYNLNRKAMTFIELTVCILVASIVFHLIFEFMSNTRKNYMFGVVNLQNLQDARLAINTLRRDFASSCPKFKIITTDKDDMSNDTVPLAKFRRELISTPNAQSVPDNQNLIQITDHDLVFYKYLYGSNGANPKVERVTYQFDGKNLVRTSSTKPKLEFKGFEDVQFKLYTHALNPDVPLLWVKFRVHESSNMYGSNKIGKPLEITTTISSNFINSSVNNKYWRFETGFTE